MSLVVLFTLRVVQISLLHAYTYPEKCIPEQLLYIISSVGLNSSSLFESL